MAGCFPLSIAESYAAKTLTQLKAENSYQKKLHTAGILQNHLDSLQKKLSKSLNSDDLKNVAKLINKEFHGLISVDSSTPIIHHKSDGELLAIENALNIAIRDQKITAQKLADRLTKIEDEIDKAGRNIARAPLESKIKPLMDELNAMQKKLADAQAQKNQFVENYKRLIRDSMELVRKLEKLSTQAFDSLGSHRAAKYAQSSKEVLKVFSKEMAKKKISDLENEFVKSFHQLARKDDIQIAAKIDPANFSVTLYDNSGQAIDKNRLSEGEKQIYAISILEALARTSGRKLPIIIDTPLGRLDSKHRTKLVNNYFPQASHQVIILSTDTEVDEEFYRELAPSISHAYKLNYDSSTGSTQPSEEYFWKPLLEATA